MDSDLPLNIFLLLVVLIVLLIVAVSFYVWRRDGGLTRWQIRSLISAISHDCLKDVVIPDGLDGEVQIQHLLLTSRGLLVLDIKDVQGAIFAGNNMQNWTVLNGSQRFTIPNPQEATRRRVAAVKKLAGAVPVIGRIAFTPSGEFARSVPEGVTMLSTLRAEFDEAKQASQRSVDAYYQQWIKLRQLAVAA